VNRREEIIKIKAETNKMENAKANRQNNTLSTVNLGKGVRAALRPLMEI